MRRYRNRCRCRRCGAAIHSWWSRCCKSWSEGGECSVSNAFIETTIDVLPENQISRELLDKPNKRGNAFVFKKDGTAVEIHHVGQSADGPYLEMHRSDHRGKGNYKENHPNADASTQIDRKEFNKQRRYYWQKEYDKYYK